MSVNNDTRNTIKQNLLNGLQQVTSKTTFISQVYIIN